MIGDQMASEDVYAVALRVLSATVDASCKEHAILDANILLGDLDDTALRRVAACLAVETVWSRLPDVFVDSLTGHRHLASKAQAAWRLAVRTWVDQLSLEVAWHAPTPETDR